MTVATEFLKLAAVAGVLVLLARFLCSYLHLRKLEMAIPGPPSLWLLGNALDLASASRDTVLQVLLRLLADTPVSRVSILNHLIVAVKDPDGIQEVVRRKDFSDKSFLFYSFTHVVAKRGLVQLNGADWKAHRKWLAPGFNKNVLDSFVGVFSEEAQGFLDRIETDRDFEVMSDLRRTSLRNFLRTSLDEEMSKMEDDMFKFMEFADMFLKSINERAFNPLLWSNTLFQWTPAGREVIRMKPIIDGFATDAIMARRASRSLQRECYTSELGPTRKTVIEIAFDESEMPWVDVLDEVKTFAVANVETTASATSWLLKSLSLLPEVQERVYAELQQVFGNSNRVVTAEDLPKLKYLDRVVKECLRMFPPIPLTARQCYEETRLCGYTIPAGATVVINIIRAHYNPKHWDHPEIFDPDRFLPERSKGRHPCAYIPFSTGVRDCIGRRYAINSLLTFAATVLRAYRLLPAADHKDLQSLYDSMTMEITSRLVGGVRVRFQAREAAA